MAALLLGLAGQASAKIRTTVSIMATPNPVTYYDPVFITVAVSPAAASGTVDYLVDGVDKGQVLSDICCLSLTFAVGILGGPGTHSVQATYSGDSNYFGSSSSSITVTVNQAPTTITFMTTPNPSTVGQQVTLTASVSPGLTGYINFFDINNPALPLFTVNLGPSGTVIWQTTALAPGTHNLAASYSGDVYDAGSVSTTPVAQTVNQITTATSLQAGPNPSTPGQSVTLMATVSPATATGTVSFLDGSTTIGRAGLSAGTAIFTPTLSAGSHSLTASYGGDTNDAPSVSPPVTEAVQNATTTSLQAAPATSTAGQNVVLTATVSPATATGTVTFLDGSTTIGTGGLNGGTASFSASNLSAGSHSLTASYGGDTIDTPSVSPAVTETVNQIATTTSLQAVPASSSPGQKVVLTATVSPATATGLVTFLDGKNGIGSQNLSAGTASLSASALSAGSHTLTASYGGDTNDASSYSSQVTVTVGLPGTTTSLKAGPASSNPGQNVTLTATVSPATAGGTVTFLDGSNPLGSPQTLSGGTASFSTSNLSIGSHSLTASYGGDANDAPSYSPAVTESVGLQTTTTALAAAPTPATAGQKVTLTATVSPGDPAGSVSFFDGANLLGTAPVANAVATISTATLSGGIHSLTATYGGDANNAPSTSPAFNESVSGGSGSTTPNPVSVSPASGSGSSQVMTFTFNDASGWQDLGVVNVLINNVLDGRNACYLAYSRPAGVLYLVEDNGGTLSAGLALGGAGSVSNSQCTVAGASSVASGSGNTLTLILNLSFAAGFGGNKVVYLAAGDVAGGNSGWQALGVWQAPFTPTGTIAVVSLTAARSTAAPGTPQTLTATLTDSRGTGDFGVVNVLVSNFIDGRQACYLAYVASTNTLLLVDDGGDAGGPFAGSMALNGGAATIQNSQCSVNGLGSVAAKGGNTLTLILNVTFQAAFAGNRIVWAAGRDAASGNNTDWQAVGTTTVQ